MTAPTEARAIDAEEWLIRKGGYFYRPNCQGYTIRKIEAGRYTKAKAEREASVEPWHMSAIHQDDIPDEPAIADALAARDAQISALQAQVERLTKDRDMMEARAIALFWSVPGDTKIADVRVLEDRASALIAAEAQVERLTRERDAWFKAAKDALDGGIVLATAAQLAALKKEPEA